MTVDSDCYAVIFTSRLNNDAQGYEAMAARMVELARAMPGFLGMESARGADGAGITISWWESLEDIALWKAHPEHREAQELGRRQWYESYRVQICKVLRDGPRRPPEA